MQAAEAGVPEAMYHLGVAYVSGVGVRKQDSAAAKWLMAGAYTRPPFSSIQALSVG
jgi:TPR repeat protein